MVPAGHLGASGPMSSFSCPSAGMVTATSCAVRLAGSSQSGRDGLAPPAVWTFTRTRSGISGSSVVIRSRCRPAIKGIWRRARVNRHEGADTSKGASRAATSSHAAASEDEATW